MENPEVHPVVHNRRRGGEGHVVENGYAGLRTWIEKARRAAAIDGAEVKLVGRLHSAGDGIHGRERLDDSALRRDLAASVVRVNDVQNPDTRAGASGIYARADHSSEAHEADEAG